MNRQNNHELIVSAIRFDLTPSLKTFVQEKSEKLFRHQERIVRLRVDLECDLKETVAHRFKAKGLMEIYGPDVTVAVSADNCHKAVSMLVDKLDRMLRKRACARKGKRNHPGAIEFPGVSLPKIA